MKALPALLLAALCTTAFADKAPTTKGIIDPTKCERPADAVELVGDKEHLLVPEEGKASKWIFEDGVLTASPVWDSLFTKEAYRDFRLHVEFNINKVENPKNQEADGNSGIYIQQRYEIQIQNAHGIPKEEFKPSYGGSLYKLKAPDQLVSKKPGEWQSYDIVFRAARFKDGEKTENARITVYHNGTLIHDDFELPRKTGAGKKEGPDPLPTKFQGHHNPVKFRKVWIQALELD